MRNLIASMVLAVFGTIAYAGDNDPLIVVELYTSEGCSSCPPADKMLTELSKRDDILALALHVDYWDYLGWKDKFAIAKFTKRQEYYNMALGSRYRLVTPQMVFQGQSHVAGAKFRQVQQHLVRLAAQADKVLLNVEKQNGTFRVNINPHNAYTATADVFIVQYEPEHTAEIKAGENRGLTLNHTNIVTSWERIGEWNGQKNWYVDHAVTEGSSAAVIVQAADYGPILAARKLK